MNILQVYTQWRSRKRLACVACTQACKTKGDNALLLLGHGSSKNPNTRKPVCQAATKLREEGNFDQILCGFLKQAPTIPDTLRACRAKTITILPFFISKGYYTDVVIPKMVANHLATRDVTMLDPLGDHCLFARLIVARAQEAGATAEDTVAVLGHGTQRNPQSEKNVYLQTERVKALHLFREVVTVFIDQPPWVQDLFETTSTKRVFIVPLFVADGWHVTETIPDDLNMKNGVVQNGERSLHMTPAVGTHPDVYKIILERLAHISV